MNMKPALLTPETMSVKGFDLLEKIQDDFIGLDTKYKLADGTISPRIYFSENLISFFNELKKLVVDFFLEFFSLSTIFI